MGKKIVIIKAILIVIIIAVASWLIFNKDAENQTGGDSGKPPVENPQRIISLAPSITETIYALGLEERLVARTRYCVYPPEVEEVPEIGGYFDPNYEMILSLEPELVIMFPEHEEIQQRFKEFDLKFLTVNQRTIAGIKESIRLIAETCGVKERGAELIGQIEKDIEAVRVEVEPAKRPSVLVVVGRSEDAGTITDVYVAGEDNFYNELLALAGARNAYSGDVRFPVMGAEGIISLDPDVILEIAVDVSDENLPEYEAAWELLHLLKAVQNDNVHVLNQQVAAISGPRIARILALFVSYIHQPEVTVE